MNLQDIINQAKKMRIEKNISKNSIASKIGSYYPYINLM